MASVCVWMMAPTSGLKFTLDTRVNNVTKMHLLRRRNSDELKDATGDGSEKKGTGQEITQQMIGTVSPL
jgi:hypothetical protein